MRLVDVDVSVISFAPAGKLEDIEKLKQRQQYELEKQLKKPNHFSRVRVFLGRFGKIKELPQGAPAAACRFRLVDCGRTPLF